MATVLKFKQGDSGTELNLNSSTVGFTLEEAGWLPAVAMPVHMGDPAPVMERIDLFLNQTTYNALAASMQSLHEMQVLADRYINDPHQETPVWLHAQMDGETNQRRALVRRIDVQYKPQFFGQGEVTTYVPVLLTVVRGPYWESTTARSLPDAAPSAAACVVYDYTASPSHNIVGDVGARIRFFELLNNNFSLNEFWMGIRSDSKHGATGISNFEPIWELEDGGLNVDATSTIDATASGGDNVTISESTYDWDDGTWRTAITMDLDNVTANPEDLFGNFLWVLRAKCAVTSTWEVRLKFSHGAYDPVIYTSPVEINDASWTHFELGVMPIPLYNFQSLVSSDFSKANIDEYRADVQARRTSGSDDFLLDCLITIPVDEGFCKISSTGYSGVFTNMISISPSGIAQAVIRTSTSELSGLCSVDSIENFVLPLGDGRIYCIYASGGDDITDTITFNDGNTGKYYERWLSLRGAE